ncbi:TIGR00725 family protein [Oxyplasma meridianum]|uniref:TIGR00725 family protein n=1 Tax=Oxyplasma meridianum TaxID=3073602 RepID=A0AAX4NF19_9ARCH
MYNIGVIGGSTADDRFKPVAYEVGSLLAKRKAVVFCGGLGGVMEWVSHGIHDNGGVVVGILPGSDVKDGNEFLNVKIPTGIGYLRNFLIVRASEALIAIDGSSGTLSEAAFAITEGKLVVALGDMEIDHRKPGDGTFVHASTPEEAVNIAFSGADQYRSVADKRKGLNQF